MQKHDDSNIPTFIADTSNTSQPQVRDLRSLIVVIVMASIGLLVFFSWLIQPYITYKPALKLLGYSCAVILATSYFALTIAPLIRKRSGSEQKQLSYIAFVIGAILLFPSSLGLLFVIHKPEHGWWGYFFTVIMLAGFTTTTFSDLVSKEQKRLMKILRLTGLFFLIIGGFVPVFLELHN